MEKDIRKELNLVNVEKSYNALKLITVVSIIAVGTFFSIAYVYLNNQNLELANRIVYIDSNGMVGSGEVRSIEDKDVYIIQMKASLNYSVPFLYSFNSSNFDEQIEKGLKLFGEPGKIIYQNYLNDKVKEKVISSNLRVECQILNTEVEEINNELLAIITFRQSFSSKDNVGSARTITAQARMDKVNVSNSNPFGFIITDWVILKEER